MGVDAFFSFFLFLLSLFVMPVVKNHSGQKHAQSIWDFTTKFPDSLTVERYVYCRVLEAKTLIYQSLCRWLLEQGIYCNEVWCKAGKKMRIAEMKKEDGRVFLIWKCSHGPLPECNRQKKSVREGSFFSGLKIGMHQVLGIIWLYLYKMEFQAIQDLIGVSAPTVRSVIHLLYRLMNADIKEEDVSVGRTYCFWVKYVRACIEY